MLFRGNPGGKDHTGNVVFQVWSALEVGRADDFGSHVSNARHVVGDFPPFRPMPVLIDNERISEGSA